MNIRLTQAEARLIESAAQVQRVTVRAFIRNAADAEARRVLGQQHASDCALHNAPAMPMGNCDCR